MAVRLRLGGSGGNDGAALVIRNVDEVERGVDADDGAEAGDSKVEKRELDDATESRIDISCERHSVA